MTIAVRPGGVADRHYVDDLGRRTVMDSVSSLRKATPHEVFGSLDRLFETVSAQSNVLFIAECDGDRAGFFLMLDELPDEVTSQAQGFIAFMAVEPRFRRSGVGAALLEAGEGEARRRGLPYLALMVTENNAPARALYERSGYVTERRLMIKPL